MKKLLFTALMGLSLSLFSGENQGQVPTQEEQIYLMDYLEYAAGDVPTLDCKKINALSDDQFFKLLHRAMPDGHVMLGGVPSSEYQRREINIYKLLKRVHRCRPVVPFFWIKQIPELNAEEAEALEQLLEKGFEEGMKNFENEAIRAAEIKKVIKEKGIEYCTDVVFAEGWLMARKDFRDAWCQFMEELRKDLKNKRLSNKNESA